MRKRVSPAILLALFGFLLFSPSALGESPRKKDGGDQEPYLTQSPGDRFKDKIFLLMEAEKPSAYLYETIRVTIKIRVNGFSIKDVQYPKFAHEGFFKSEFDDPLKKEEIINGVKYETIEFKTLLFGTEAGSFNLGPAQLQCNLQADKTMGQTPLLPPGGNVREDYFGARETFALTLKSEGMSLRILPLPENGKPRDFNDAVGNFRFRLEVQPREVRVGEPITLRMVIEGKGNFIPITAPQFKAQSGFKIYRAQAIQKSSSKIFEQVIIPQTENLREIPRIHFSHFDPEKNIYRVLNQGPVPLRVSKPSSPEDLKSGEKSSQGIKDGEKGLIGRDIIYIKESPGKLVQKGDFLYKNKTFLLLQGIPLLISIVIFGFHRQRERLKNDLIYAAQRRASKKIKQGMRETSRILRGGISADFYDCLFKTLQAYLVDKFNISPGEISLERIHQQVEKNGGIEILRGKFENIFAQCDLARYASAKFEKAEMERTFEDFKNIIGYLEKKK
jgi:hypothetical protein